MSQHTAKRVYIKQYFSLASMRRRMQRVIVQSCLLHSKPSMGVVHMPPFTISIFTRRHFWLKWENHRTEEKPVLAACEYPELCDLTNCNYYDLNKKQQLEGKLERHLRLQVNCFLVLLQSNKKHIALLIYVSTKTPQNSPFRTLQWYHRKCKYIGNVNTNLPRAGQYE